MSDPDDRTTDAPRRRPGAGRVVPSWVVVPLAGGAGFLTAGWPGLVFGLVLGFFLSKIRS